MTRAQPHQTEEATCGLYRHGPAIQQGCVQHDLCRAPDVSSSICQLEPSKKTFFSVTASSFQSTRLTQSSWQKAIPAKMAISFHETFM
jgi:hypothetical protein